MTENKLTETEIMKAAECCKSGDCVSCPLSSNRYESKCKTILFEAVVDLINRKNAENERLRNEIGSLNKAYPCTVSVGNNCLVYARSLDDYDRFIGDVATEAIKEYIKRLKYVYCGLAYRGLRDDIDDLAKEMGCGE